MPSIRTDKQIFPFFDSVKNPITSIGVSDAFHNNGFGTMTIEVDGVAGGYVEGCMNIINSDGSAKTDNECSWTKLALINMEDFSVSSTFTTTGKYCIGINGMTRVRVVLTSISGSAVIVGTAEA